MNKNLLDDLLNTQGHINEDELSAYLSDRATPDVRRKVESVMLDDDLFSDAVEGYQEMGFTAVPGLESFSEFKKKLPASTTEGARIVRLAPAQIFLRAVAVAAGVILCVVAYQSIQTPTTDSLYAGYYAHYENDISLTRRGDEDGLNKDFKNALGQYATGEFSAALSGFEKALAAEPDNNAALFFSGIACLELNRYKEAIQHLERVKAGESTYSRKAYWYTILATLKSGDADSAKKMLEDFVKTQGYKQEEAKRLLSKL